MFKPPWVIYLGTMVLALGLLGCKATDENKQLKKYTSTPPDFAIELFVQGTIGSINSRIQRSKYLLEPNHRLHLALDHQAENQNYPVRYIKLRIAQYDQLIGVATQANLMAEPSSPYAEEILSHQKSSQANKPLIHVAITSWGKTNRYVTTGQDSPPTQILLDKMILYTGRKLPDHATDSHRGY